MEALAQLLREAEEAHGQYETQLGHSDADWPRWYAAYMLPKLQSKRVVRKASAAKGSAAQERS